jgi:hypothetical protein
LELKAYDDRAIRKAFKAREFFHDICHVEPLTSTADSRHLHVMGSAQGQEHLPRGAELAEGIKRRLAFSAIRVSDSGLCE